MMFVITLKDIVGIVMLVLVFGGVGLVVLDGRLKDKKRKLKEKTK